MLAPSPPLQGVPARRVHRRQEGQHTEKHCDTQGWSQGWDCSGGGGLRQIQTAAQRRMP